MRKAKSPYQRYEKRPTRYSAEHQAWRHAVTRNDDKAISDADRAWRRRFVQQSFSFHGSPKLRSQWDREAAE